MNNHIKTEEIDEDSLSIQTPKLGTPRKEYSSLSQKKIKKMDLSDKLSKSQIIPAKSIQLDSPIENITHATEKKIPHIKLSSIEVIKNPKIPSKNKNKIKIKEKNENYDYISLNELSDDENAEKPIIIESKISHRSQNINNKEMKSFNYCGKKRKNPEKVKERIISQIQKKNNCVSNYAENKKKRKITNLNMDKNIINLIDDNSNDDKRRKNISEKKILSNLVKKEGFIKIFDYLSISPLNRKNQIERELDDIILNIGLLRTTILLFQIQIELSNNNTINRNKNIELEKLIPIDNNMNLSKNSFIKKNELTSNSDKDYIIEKIHIIDDDVEEGKKIKIKKSYATEKRIESTPKPSKIKNMEISNNKNLKNVPKKKNNISSSKMVSIKKEALNKELDISVHLQKDKDGKIYKYTKRYLSSDMDNPFYTFYCADRKCGAKAYYYIKSMKFENIINHILPHSEHNYIKSMNRENKYNPIVGEFIKRNYHEAQIFLKKDGTQLVKWYDQL